MDTQQNRLLAEIVHSSAMDATPDTLASWKSSGMAVQEGVRPSMSIRPLDAEELQKVLALANKEDVNLTVASSKPPHRKGGLAATQDNWLVDLSHWDEIVWINRRNRVALIQPGVTYSQLQEALAAEGMTLSMPLAPREGKSVLASIMDREPTTWPNKQWDIGDPAASTEFVFGNGEIFRTGAAGGPGSLEEQRKAGGAQKSSAGPSQTDFHRVVGGAQGTMGVLTWISVRTELKPSLEKPYLIGSDTLHGLVPFMYDVQRPWLGEHSFLLNKAALALLMGAEGREEARSSWESSAPYVCLQNIAGFERLPAERIGYQEEDIGKMATRHGLQMMESLDGLQAKDLLNAATKPCGDTDWRCQRSGDCLSLFFLTTLDRTTEFEAIFMDLVRKNGMDQSKIGMYVQPVVQNHACHVEFMVPFDPEKEAQVDSVRSLEARAVSVLMDAGAFFSRPYGTAGKVVFDKNPLNFDMLKKVKNIFDPNRVLNRGKWDL